MQNAPDDMESPGASPGGESVGEGYSQTLAQVPPPQLCVPVGHFGALVELVASHLKLGLQKSPVGHPPHESVPLHPLAGAPH